MLHNRKKSGFTLIELIVAISIFVIFIMIIASMFLHFIETQKRMDQQRVLLKESRELMTNLSFLLRMGHIDFEHTDIDNLVIAIDEHSVPTVTTPFILGSEKITFSEDDNVHKDLWDNEFNILNKSTGTVSSTAEPLHPEYILIKHIKYYLTPDKEQSATGIEKTAEEFQPLISIYFTAVHKDNPDIEISLFTSISSRALYD